jgi:hypothetical protein
LGVQNLRIDKILRTTEGDDVDGGLWGYFGLHGFLYQPAIYKDLTLKLPAADTIVADF